MVWTNLEQRCFIQLTQNHPSPNKLKIIALKTTKRQLIKQANIK